MKNLLPFFAILFLFCNSNAFAQPANDNVCNAIWLGIDEECISYEFTNEFSNSQEGEPNCLSFEANTVWFKFVAPTSGGVRVQAKADGGSLLAGNTLIGVYSVVDCGNFSTFNQLDCSIGSTTNLDVIPGQTYYIQIDGSFSNRGTFCIEVLQNESPNTLPCMNDNVCEATDLTLGEVCTFTTNECASFQNNEPYPSCFFGNSTEEFNSVWFKFVAPSSGRVNITESGALSTQIAIYNFQNCSNFGTAIEVYCSGNSSNFVDALIPGTTYYIQVDGFANEKGSICLEIEECAPIPSNDNVCEATDLTLGEVCTFTTNECASFQNNEPYPSCFFGNSTEEFNSVWFKFVAPSSGRVNITESGALSTQIAIYNFQNCSNFGTAIEVYCSGNSSNFVDALIPGTTYYIQVDGFANEKGSICLEIEDADALDCPDPDQRFLTGTISDIQIYQAASLINSTQTLTSSSDVEYVAGSAIILATGFSASGNFVARIEDCAAVASSEKEELVENRAITLDSSEEKVFDFSSDLEVFPNPTNTIVNIAYNVPENQQPTILIFDVNGRIVSTINSLNSGVSQYQLPVDNFEKGIYLIRFTCGEKTVVKKLIIQ